MANSFGIALLGCGTVGGGVARLLLEDRDRLSVAAGRPIELRHVVVRDLGKRRSFEIPPNLISTLEQSLADPGVHLVVEAAGGTGWAKNAVLSALSARKHVVTANKALISEHGLEVFDAARRTGVAVRFEASVAGGVPIIAALSQSFAGNPISSLQGILNGTANFILTRMSEHDCTYAEALAEAQIRGYAEADPTLDVNGTDSAHKLAILAQLAFGVRVRGSEIVHRGIANVDSSDLRFAGELGYAIKLVAEAWAEEDSIALHVSPLLLRRESPLAQVRGVNNAIRVCSRLAEDCFFSGPGAGQMPTASAILADILSLAGGQGQGDSRIWPSWPADLGDSAAPTLRNAAMVRSRFYLRLLVADRPGVLADIAHALGDRGISIASVMQHEGVENGKGFAVPVVIMTHTALNKQFQQAIEKIDDLQFMASPCVHFPVAD